MRASTLNSYPGQAALPGGKADFLAETPFQTARREAFEEIGLPNDDSKVAPPFRVEHICQLPLNLAKNELGVRPCVAFLHSGEDADNSHVDVEKSLMPRLDAKEVAAVFTAPFHNFLMLKDELPDGETQGDDNERTEWYQGQWMDWHETKWRMHDFYVPIAGQTVTKPKNKSTDQGAVADQLEKLKRYRVFGMTARILVDAARLAYNQEPEFEHNSHWGDEDVIRRLLKMGRLSPIRKPGDELAKGDMLKASKI
ncbi:NUDIX hydrolase domain-like [Lasallia pustulata]|uniref:NUDIX hydrolase domain-like n=1 Tax=Lasallia pustulata TaxID=136370 RepID=A0A1W5D3S6_9LECA|nr:NUDIX hydrolase domain-like [Lasallia pustulata]